MSKLDTKPYKGTRDFYPEDLRLRDYIFSKWREVCQSFGYEEYDASAIESMELYTAKTSEEIVGEQTFSFEDRGGRKVTLRPEMTPTASRMVAARRQELGYPLRLFSIPNCFRYERMQRGRTREFWQLNADLFGVDGIEADLEMILIADRIMESFGAQPESYEIQVNSRKLTSWLLEEYFKVPADNTAAVMRLIDAQEKMEPAKFKDALNEAMGEAEGIQLSSWLEKNSSLDDLPAGAPTGDIKQVIERAEASSVNNVRWHLGLARGFDYYTDLVFEVFDTNPDNNRSMFGGGRYDGLVGEFGVEPIPTVGFAAGDITMQNFLESNHLVPELPTENNVYLMVEEGKQAEAQAYAQELRAEGQNVAVDLSGRKRDKQFKAAKKLGFTEDKIQWFEG